MFVTAPKDLSFPSVQIATGADVAAGETVDVPDEIGSQLIDQGWSEAKGVKPPTIPEVLAEVGDDPAKASAEIAAEEARDKPRPTLIEKLAAVIAANPNPAPDGADTKES